MKLKQVLREGNPVSTCPRLLVACCTEGQSCGGLLFGVTGAFDEPVVSLLQVCQHKDRKPHVALAL